MCMKGCKDEIIKIYKLKQQQNSQTCKRLIFLPAGPAGLSEA